MIRFRLYIFGRNLTETMLTSVVWCRISILVMITQIAPLRWLLQGFSTVKLLFLLLQLISILSGNTLRPRKYTIPHQMLRIFSYLFIVVLTHHFTIPWVIIHYCHYLFWCLNGLRFGWWVPIQAGFSVISYKTIILFFWLKYSWCTISCKLKSSFFWWLFCYVNKMFQAHFVLSWDQPSVQWSFDPLSERWYLEAKIWVWVHSWLLGGYCWIELRNICIIYTCVGLFWFLSGKESACGAGDLGSIPRLGRSPGEGNSNPLQYSCLENPMDRGACWAIVHGSQKSLTQVSD